MLVLLIFLSKKERNGLTPDRKKCAVERHVDALERDGREAALKVDGLGFGLGLLRALLDDFH